MSDEFQITAERKWISVDFILPDHGQRVEVWVLKNRLAHEDEADFGKWQADYGTCCRGRWSVGDDPLAVCSHWRSAPDGPQ